MSDIKVIEEMIEDVERDMERLSEPKKVDVRKRNRELFREMMDLVEEVEGDEEYGRLCGDKEPKDVDLSLYKEMSDGLKCKIVRIQNILEEKDVMMWEIGVIP